MPCLKFKDWIVLTCIGALLIGCNSVSTRFVTGLSAEERALAAELPGYRKYLGSE
jgi:protein-S-isoprenylcysteine O-methyltransferase Ste14